MSLPVALQLYTVRDPLAKDFEGTLAQVARIGLKWVEFAGLHGRTAEQAKKTVDQLGLQVSSAHVGIELLGGDLTQAISDARTLGYKFICCPYLGNNYRTLEGYREAARILNDAGKRLADQGLTLCYHNHSFEWEKLADGSTGMNILFNETDPRYLQSELDVYWVQHGGDNPLDWMRKLNKRAPLLHIKDMARTADRGFTEVGTGTVDIAGVAQLAPQIGAQFLILEQDSAWKNNSPLESVQLSYTNFERILKQF